MIKRFAILCVLFFIVCGKLPDFFCNQVASPLQFFQQKRRAELRHRADISAVKAAINNTGKVILQDHIEHCIVDAVSEGDTKALEELNRAIDRFMK